MATNYDRLARWYDLIAGPAEARYRDAALALLAPRPGEAILEIGPGTGHALVALARAVGSAGLVCGLDLSVGMCRVAGARLRKASVALAAHDSAVPTGENVIPSLHSGQALSRPSRERALRAPRQGTPSCHPERVNHSKPVTASPQRRISSPDQRSSFAAAAALCGDAARLPWRGAAFDAVFMSFTLELFPEPELPVVLAECRRVLRPGGRVAVAALAEPTRPNWMTRLYGWAHRRFPAVVDCRPLPAEALLAAHGFAVERAQRGSLWGLPVVMVAAYCA